MICYDGKVVVVFYILNVDSLVFNYGVIGEELISWEVLFDS